MSGRVYKDEWVCRWNRGHSEGKQGEMGREEAASQSGPITDPRVVVLERGDDHPEQEAEARGSSDHKEGVSEREEEGLPRKEVLDAADQQQRPARGPVSVLGAAVVRPGRVRPDELHAEEEVGGKYQQGGAPGCGLDQPAVCKGAHVALGGRDLDQGHQGEGELQRQDDLRDQQHLVDGCAAVVDLGGIITQGGGRRVSSRAMHTPQCRRSCLR